MAERIDSVHIKIKIDVDEEDMQFQQQLASNMERADQQQVKKRKSELDEEEKEEKLTKGTKRRRKVENRGMSFDLNENKDIYHSNSLPIVSKPPSLNLQPPSTGIHDGASDNYQPDAHHQTHNIQDAGRDIEAMDKELDRQKREEKKSMYT